MASIFSAPHFTDEAAAYAYVEARLWVDGRVCPHCGVVERSGALKGKSNRIGLYKCYACRKPFTVKVGTIFECSHIPMRDWLVAIHLICASKKGISSNQLHRTLGITLKSAWFMSHRIREAVRDERGVFTPELGGEGKTVEADETYVGRKAASKAFRAPAEKQSVFALVERNGSVRSFHVANVRASVLKPIIEKHVSKQTKMHTDEAGFYGIAVSGFRDHETVNHSAKEYVRGTVHTNTVEGYFSILKRGIYGVYQHVSEAHLQRYLAEFDFRYSNRVATGVDDVARADLALTGALYKRLTYRTARGARAAQVGQA